uniref:Uncharacterized protein n=1 Tax=Solanum lycopersicum TaxID=4081 RepID=A0A3Q7GTN6_SOLLC
MQGQCMVVNYLDILLLFVKSMCLLFLRSWWNNASNNSLTKFRPRKKRGGGRPFPEIGRTLSRDKEDLIVKIEYLCLLTIYIF